MASGTPLIRMSGIDKGFPGVQALRDVSFEADCGEVHALVGENGAGKSTLMKILSGNQQPDAGTIELRGKVVRFASPAEAIAAGIGTIHQELTVIPHLSVAENIFLGTWPTRGFAVVARRRMVADASELLRRLGLDLDPERKVGELPIGLQQLVEIARSLSRNADLIIMDEPTSSLSHFEAEALWAIIARLRAQGRTVIFISHKIDEVFRLADRATVLRDGQRIATEKLAALTPDRLVSLMVGRDLLIARPDGRRSAGRPVLEATGLTRDGTFADVGFAVRAGEIVALAGLVGSGRTEVARAIFGADRLDGGTIRIDGKRLPASPRAAIAAGIGFVPEDRKEQALILQMSVQENIVLPATARTTHWGVLDIAAETRTAAGFVERMDIRAASLDQIVRNLSGGNQQKVVLARWLAMKPRLLIVDEPTRGIDVGAKAEIHALLRRLADEGIAILLISSEMAEILALGDRILVMRAGRIVAEIAGGNATEAIVGGHALGLAAR